MPACLRDLLRALEARGLYATGDLQAHHIVPHGAYKDRAAADSLARAQAKLKSLGVDIDDAGNGVYLPKGCHQAVGHTNEVFRQLDSGLSTATTRDENLGFLHTMGQQLHNKCL